MKWVLHTFKSVVATMLIGSAGLLHAQTVSSTSDGVVFRDLNDNGSKDADEAGIPGVLVELRKGSQTNFNATLYASAITDASGAYAFSKDVPPGTDYQLRFYYPQEAFETTTPVTGTTSNFARITGISISEETPSQTANLGLKPKSDVRAESNFKALTFTNWTDLTDITLPKSPAGLGTLVGVKVYYNLHVYNPLVSVKNDWKEGDPQDPNTSGQFTTTANFLTPPFTHTGGDEPPTGVERAFTVNYLYPISSLPPGESLTLTKLHGSAGGEDYSLEYDASEISDFIGDETFPVPFSSNGLSSFGGSGNFTASIETQSSVGVFVVYIYEEGSLPVKLADFSARTEGSIGVLNWSTTEETNSFAFEVERSANGKKWATIGTVAAKGESNRLVNYTFSDAGLTKGVNYYRLKMVDIDGSFNRSHVISLRSSFGKEVTASTYPNPTSESVFLQNIDAGEIQSIDVINTTGRTLLNSKAYDSVKGIDVRNLPNGLYLVRYTLTSGEQQALKVLVRH